jgi:hypothetical protein
MPKSPRSSPNPIRVTDVLTYAAVQLLDVTGPAQGFASANIADGFLSQSGDAALAEDTDSR